MILHIDFFSTFPTQELFHRKLRKFVIQLQEPGPKSSSSAIVPRAKKVQALKVALSDGRELSGQSLQNK